MGFQKSGLSQLVVQGPVTDKTIGSHPAKVMTYPTDDTACLVAIGVTSQSRVDLSIESNGGVDPCSIAMRAAELVEQHLPTAG